SRELAFVSLDFRTDLRLVVIYELFVLTELRGKGLGTAILKAAENLATEHGFMRTVVVPEPIGLRRDTSAREEARSRLIRWYERNGYRPRPNTNNTEWEKSLRPEFL